MSNPLSIFFEIVSIIFQLWFLWLPVFLLYLFWTTWVNNARLKTLRGLNWKLLEIKVPRDIVKSPRAMETVLDSLYSSPKSGGWFKRMKSGFKGNLAPWHSFEIASINGQIHFFVYLQESFRNLFESQIYAQYPNSEISEVDDYTKAANFENLNEWDLWSAELGLNKEDPYPIRTYVDYGLHEAKTKDAEEQKIDPLVSFLELLGSFKEGEQAWFQIMIKSTGKGWIDEGKKIIDDLMGRNVPAGEETKQKSLSKGEQEVVSAIDRNISKSGFETGIRVLYTAKKDVFSKENHSALLAIMNQYNAQNLNGFKPVRGIDPSPFGFLFKNERLRSNKLSMLDAFRQRVYFNIPYRRKPFIFNTEELATMYHFPGRVAETPTFSRVESKKASAPSNLPI